jgi:hypothetical protein
LSNAIVTIADLLAAMRAGRAKVPGKTWLAQRHLQAQRVRPSLHAQQTLRMQHRHRMGTDGLSVE